MQDEEFIEQKRKIMMNLIEETIQNESDNESEIPRKRRHVTSTLERRQTDHDRR